MKVPVMYFVGKRPLSLWNGTLLVSVLVGIFPFVFCAWEQWSGYLPHRNEWTGYHGPWYGSIESLFLTFSMTLLLALAGISVLTGLVAGLIQNKLRPLCLWFLMAGGQFGLFLYQGISLYWLID